MKTGSCLCGAVSFEVKGGREAAWRVVDNCRMISITAYGDVMPCPWIYLSLGNVFDTPLSKILAKSLRYFGPHTPLCRMSEDREFTELYTNQLSGRDDLPVPIEQP